MSETSRIENLFDQKAMSQARDAAEKRFGNLTSDQIEYIRKRAKEDLFFLSTGLLEYSKLQPLLHGNMCQWLEGTRGSNYRLLLKPRGHYKSTIDTIADGVQISLPNVSESPEFPYCLGPNVKILIGHEVRETAADFLYEITAAYTRKPGMLAFFPECIPTKNVERLNKWELEIGGRTEFPKEATFNTIGAGGAAQGAHYNWLKLDDIIGAAARDSPTVMRSTIQWFDNILSLLTDPTDGWDLIGTRWAADDVYSHAMRVYGIDEKNSVLKCIPKKDVEKYKGGSLKVYARGVIEDGKPIFPEIMTPERIRVLRKNRLIWAAQYANNPQEAGLAEFYWPLKFYNVANNGDLVVFAGTSSWRVRLFELDICIFVDPSMGESLEADETGIIVTGVDVKNNIFVLETVKKRLLPPQLIDKLFELYFKYRPRAIAIEEVNFSAIYKYWLTEKATNGNVTLPLRSYKPGSKRTKVGRIRGLTHFFSAGQVYIAEGMYDLRDEYETFHVGNYEKHHLLDALAQGPEFWEKGNSSREVESNNAAVNQVLEDERSVHTGY